MSKFNSLYVKCDVYAKEVAWNGVRFIAVGEGTNTIAHSNDGITWYGSPNNTNIFTVGNGVASNPRIGAVLLDSQIVLKKDESLDIVSDAYYNVGYTNMSMDIKYTKL